LKTGELAAAEPVEFLVAVARQDAICRIADASGSTINRWSDPKGHPESGSP
jgi:hypothetical protein